LERLRRRFERWRATHQDRRPIPERLWAAAVEAASTYGLHRTSKTLRLDYYSLKKRAERRDTPLDQAAGNTAGVFLELPPLGGHPVVAASAGPGECTLEWEDGSGAKMRVHLKGGAMPDLAALSRSFWNPRS
jgi:hypothetical protein